MKKKKHGLLSNFLRNKLKKSQDDYEMLSSLAIASKALDEDDLFIVTGGSDYESFTQHNEVSAEVLSLMGLDNPNDNSPSHINDPNSGLNILDPNSPFNFDGTVGAPRDYQPPANDGTAGVFPDGQPPANDGTVGIFPDGQPPADDVGSHIQMQGDPWSLINLNQDSLNQEISQDNSSVDVLKKPGTSIFGGD